MKISYHIQADGCFLSIEEDGQVKLIDLSLYDKNSTCRYIRQVLSWRNNGMAGPMSTIPAEIRALTKT